MYSEPRYCTNSCNCENNNNQCSYMTLLVRGMNNKIVNGDSSMDVKKTVSDNIVLSKNNYNTKKTKTFEVRKEEVLALRNRFPTKIPVIVQRFSKETYLPQLEKRKYLVPQEITMSQFQTIIRNKMHLHPNQALYLLVNERSMMCLSSTLGEVYSEHAGSDGFLSVTYASQEVFGQ